MLTRLRRNFEINLIFLIKSFSLHTQKVMTKDKSLNILRTNIIFKGLSLKQIEGVTIKWPSRQAIILLVKWVGGNYGGGGGGVNFERVNIEQGILWFRMIFCFLLGFFAFTSAKEFCSMVRNQTLLKIWLLPVYSIKCWHLITTDFCSVLKSSSKKIEHKKNHKKFSLTFRKEVAIKANKSLKKKKQMFGILKNENEKKKNSQPNWI